MTRTDARRIRLVSDAVVASYIHEISARAKAEAPPRPQAPSYRARSTIPLQIASAGR